MVLFFLFKILYGQYRIREILIGCGVPRNNCFEISGKDEPDPSRAKEGMRAAVPAARKPHVFETAGHQSGRRVWKSGSLRSEEKDLCEAPRFQCN